jgi:hypothetical protein
MSFQTSIISFVLRRAGNCHSACLQARRFPLAATSKADMARARWTVSPLGRNADLH